MAEAGVEEDLSPEAWSAVESEILGGTRDLIQVARSVDASFVLISNEVGLGVVPPFPWDVTIATFWVG